MRISGRIALVTGAGQGIGRAMAKALTAEGALVIVLDRDETAARRVAEETGGHAIAADVTDPEAFGKALDAAIGWRGRIDILVSNAGMAKGEPNGATSASDAHWQKSFDLHVMAHLRAARRLLPDMIAREEGAIVNVASAAGLLSQIGDAAYSASKHAAVSLAQSLAIDHGGQGIQVSVVCPLYVATPLLGYAEGESGAHDRILPVEAVAASLIAGLREGRFLILPHEEAGLFFRKRAKDMESWIKGMRALRARITEDGESDIKHLHRRI